MNKNKRQLDWEEIDMKELFDASKGDDIYDGEKRSVIEIVFDKYSERNHTLRVLHTNFSLGKPILLNLSMVPGVETLIPVGRYKAIFFIGKLFDVPTVKKEIMLEINKFYYTNSLRLEEEEGCNE